MSEPLPIGKKWLLLGASRGLGKSFFNFAKIQGAPELVRMSRRSEISRDFSKPGNFTEICQTIANLQAERIFYFAGGGPYGNFQDKAWKDHQWALNVNFVFPAFLLYHIIQSSHLSALKQIIFIGSSIAETEVDPQASMYCASKHALKGLITSVQYELKSKAERKESGNKSEEKLGKKPLDLRLFSPGYMDTELLPPHAWPRQQAGLVVSPDKVAELLWGWIHNEDDAGSHFALNSSL